MLKTQCNILPLHTEVHPVGVGPLPPTHWPAKTNRSRLNNVNLICYPQQKIVTINCGTNG